MPHRGKISRALQTGLFVLIGVSLFESAKHMLIKDVSILGSHIITIGLATVCGAVAALVVFRKQESLTRQLMRETAERKLAEERYRDLFEHANDAIMLVDADLRYTDVNKKAEEVLGYSRDELLNMKITDLIPSEQVPRSAVEFEKLRSKGSYENFVGKVRRRDGELIDVEVSSSAIFAKEHMIGSRDILRDITERKKTEADREKLIHELQASLAKVRRLSGLLPICASCKKIRDDKGYWTQIESYLSEQGGAEFTHGLCPGCAEKAMDELKKLKAGRIEL